MIIDKAAEQCAYTRQHRDVKQAWDLTLTATEQVTITAWLAGCGAAYGEAASETRARIGARAGVGVQRPVRSVLSRCVHPALPAGP